VKAQDISNQDNGSRLVALNSWLAPLGVGPVTAWRWRRKGWLPTVNICGRVYVTREAVAEFERRAAAGEFAKEHRTPKRKKAAGQGVVV
jgi:hypothetical protein